MDGWWFHNSALLVLSTPRPLGSCPPFGGLDVACGSLAGAQGRLGAWCPSLFGAGRRLSLLLVIPLTSLQVVFARVVSACCMTTGGSWSGSSARVPPWRQLGLLLSGSRWLYGAQFADAARILVRAAIGNVVNVMSHHEGSVATILWCRVLARLTPAASVALLLGVFGLAAGAGIVTAAVFGTMWVLTRRRLGMSTYLTLRPDLGLIRQTAS